jgi:hypothetical protein
MEQSGKLYSEDEMLQRAASEVAKQRMSDLERNLTLASQTNAETLTDIKQQIAQVIKMIDKQNSDQKTERKEFKEEIEKEFASKADLSRLEGKLDSLWLRITVTVGAIVSMGLVIGWTLSVINSVRLLTK